MSEEWQDLEHDTMPFLGWHLRLTASDKGLVSILPYVEAEVPARQEVKNVHLKVAKLWLNSYLQGVAAQMPSLEMRGTAFQKAVWQAVLNVKAGEVISYGALAKAMGHPKAARAVGAALGKNPLHVMVPCHRVVAAGGALTGYAGGLDKKEALLHFERESASQQYAARKVA